MQTIYTYGAENWCEDCGEGIRDRLDGEGKTPSPEQLETETYDSADYPKPFTGEIETDAPEHCAAREDCFNAITIPVPTAMFPQRYGALLTTQLTPYGIEYTADAIANAIVRPEGIPDVYSVALQVWWEHWSEEIREHWEKHYPKDIILDMLQSLLDYTSDRII